MIDVLDTPWASSILTEMEVAKIISEQEIHGWLFDMPQALKFKKELEDSLEIIDKELMPKIPQFQVRMDDKPVDNPYTKFGVLRQNIQKYLGSWSAEVVGPFSRVYWEPINLNSDIQLKEYFLAIGWTPDTWNYKKDDKGRVVKLRGEPIKTSPKITEESLETLQDGLGKMIAQRLKITHRLSLLTGLIGHVRPDGRIEARANTLGTPTSRMTHRVVVNIPKAKKKVFFGIQLRSLFIVPVGYKLVGMDAKGLENRVIAHYINREDITKKLTEGDFHEIFWEAIQMFSSGRDNAKNVEYAYFFGALNPKLGTTSDIKPKGMSLNQIGQSIRDLIEKDLPGLNELIENVKKIAEQRGWLRGLDGRKLYSRSNHSSFNLLVQSGGAIIMKTALVILYRLVKEAGLDVHFVGNFHDEFQAEVREDHVDSYIALCHKCMSEVTEHFKLNCPMAADAKAGNSWAETH